MKYQIPEQCDGCIMTKKIEKRVQLHSGKIVSNVPFCYKYWIKNEWCEEECKTAYTPDYRSLEGD